jgi:hypothetical protein
MRPRFPSIVARVNERCRCSLVRGKLFMMATEKMAVAEKAIALQRIFLVIKLFMNAAVLKALSLWERVG